VVPFTASPYYYNHLRSRQVTEDGLRLDQATKKHMAPLLVEPCSRMVICKKMDKSVYVITKRGKIAGKFNCHCIVADGDKSQAERVASVVSDFMQKHHAAHPGQKWAEVDDSDSSAHSPLKDDKHGDAFSFSDPHLVPLKPPISTVFF
jgi:hypothetical protein